MENRWMRSRFGLMSITPSITRRIRWASFIIQHIKWMEEARMDLMEQIGLSYKEMEAMEIISPVLSVSCESITAWFILMMWLSLSRGLPSITESRWKWSTG